MKKTNSFILGLMAITLLIASCKKDGGSNATPNTTTALTISLSQTTVNLASVATISISVADQNGADVTSKSVIKVNGTALTTASYKPTTAGTFNFVATKDGITSATAVLTVTTTPPPVLDSLFVSLSATTVELNTFDYVVVTVKDKNGLDITSSSQILVNGTAITANKYVPNVIDNYTITAKNGTTPSTTKKLSVTPLSPSPFTQKMLIEDFTGT